MTVVEDAVEAFYHYGRTSERLLFRVLAGALVAVVDEGERLALKSGRQLLGRLLPSLLDLHDQSSQRRACGACAYVARGSVVCSAGGFHEKWGGATTIPPSVRAGYPWFQDQP